MTAGAPGIEELRAAADRIRGFVRRTPLIVAAPAREHPGVAAELLLKLESLQVTGSFKARGAVNAVFGLPPVGLRRGVVTASGGNHGVAVAYAGKAAGVPTTIFLPRSAAADKIVKVARLGRQGGDFRRGLGRQQSGGLAIR
jgi:threonine dehydratase